MGEPRAVFTIAVYLMGESLMSRNCGRRSFYLGVVCAFAALLFTGTFAHAQHMFQLDWGSGFNNSFGQTDVQDNWAANSFPISNADRTHVVSISLPLLDTFTNQPITGLIYQGFDLLDPTAGGGLVLRARKDTTFSSTPGTVVTITLDTPVDFNYNSTTNEIMYVAVMIPGVPLDKFPFYCDTGAGSGLGGLLKTTPLGRSFFDVATTAGGAWDVNQGSDFITVLGGTHPVLGAGIQRPGNLALWAYGTNGM
jgi:hypothetical protein